MINKITISLFFICMFTINISIACESGHSIMANFDNGKVIKLDDNTLWQINSLNQVETGLWLYGENIVTCDDSLINTDDNETAQATQIA